MTHVQPDPLLPLRAHCSLLPGSCLAERLQDRNSRASFARQAAAGSAARYSVGDCPTRLLKTRLKWVID